MSVCLTSGQTAQHAPAHAGRSRGRAQRPPPPGGGGAGAPPPLQRPNPLIERAAVAELAAVEALDGGAVGDAGAGCDTRRLSAGAGLGLGRAGSGAGVDATEDAVCAHCVRYHVLTVEIRMPSDILFKSDLLKNVGGY